MTATGALRRQLTPLEPLVDRIEAAAQLDPLAKAVAGQIRSRVPSGPVKDALSGTWLGHAVHPMLTDVVIGSFTSATMVDLLAPDDGRTANRLVAVGLVSYLPTALTGGNDWADTEPVSDAVRRAGLVHAASNVVGASLYAASMAARRRGRRARGAILGLTGMTVMMAGGYLGGHLSMTRGVGPDQTVFDPGPTDWTAVSLQRSELTDGQPQRVVVDETPVLVLAQGEQLFALHDRCSHRGCSLSEGTVEGEEIVCSCHGSRFALRDGAVHQGPATAPQPAFEVREHDGSLQLRRVAGD